MQWDFSSALAVLGPVPDQRGLFTASEAWTSRCTSRHQSPSTAISHRFHAELYMTFPSAKTSWLCALWHLHIHLKETEDAFFLTEPQWKFPLSAPIRYHSWPKRRKRRVRWNKVEVGKKWKSPCLVNGPLILSPDRRQWQPGGGSGHQLAWIDTFLSRLQLSLLRASTDCNISFFPPSWKSQQPFSCHWKAGRQALCLFTHRWIENIVPKASESPSCFRLHIKHRIWEHVWKWQADWLWSFQAVWASFFPVFHQWVHSSIQDILKQ